MGWSSAHIAGVGVSHAANTVDRKSVIEATTKALLDAGLTYDDVEHSFLGQVDEFRLNFNCFSVLAPTSRSSSIHKVDNRSCLFVGVQFIRSGQAECVLAVAIDRQFQREKTASKISTVAVVFVSHRFLTSHAYLRDSSVRLLALQIGGVPDAATFTKAKAAQSIRKLILKAFRDAKLQLHQMDTFDLDLENLAALRSAIGQFEPSQSSIISCPDTEDYNRLGALHLCRLVWQLRGWTHGDNAITGAHRCLYFATCSLLGSTCSILRRSDENPVPAWENIKNVRDGRERLGYNPAAEFRSISEENVESVRSRKIPGSVEALRNLELDVKGGDRAALARL